MAKIFFHDFCSVKSQGRKMKIQAINGFKYLNCKPKRNKTLSNTNKNLSFGTKTAVKPSYLNDYDLKRIKIDTKLPEGIKSYSLEDKLNIFGIETALGEDNKLIVSEYRQPAKDISFEDIGIDEDELTDKIVIVAGNADFTNSKATSLGSIKEICGDIILKNHNIQNLGELVHVGGERILDESNFDVNFNLRYGIW